MIENPWKIVWEGNLFAIERHTKKGWERAVRPPGVRLLLTSKEGHLLLTEEFRTEVGKKDFRLPGGKVFDDLTSYLAVRNNQPALEQAVVAAARLEAKQEAGVDDIADLAITTRSTAGASVEWDLYYLTGTILAQSEQELEADEQERGIAVHFFTLETVRSMLRDDSIGEERTRAVLEHHLATLPLQ